MGAGHGRGQGKGQKRNGEVVCSFRKTLPSDGFVNKQDFPTGADCVAVYFFYAAAPGKALVKQSGFDPTVYPKFKGLSDRAAAAPGLKEYIASSTSLPCNPFEA